ncbi:MAG: DUF2520 domain-containing protein [Actinomycetota bacterium]
MIVGRGRAGSAFARALDRVGVDVDLVAGSPPSSESSGSLDTPRSSDSSGSLASARRVTVAADGADVILLCVPDDAIADVAARVEPNGAVVAHCAGSRTLDVLAPHPRVGSLHPLASLPDAVRGAARLLDSCTFAVAGDPIVHRLVGELGGMPIDLADEHRATYHAAACVAANHLVVLAAQVERLADAVGVPFEAYLSMMRDVVDTVGAAGPSAALTGPAARGDTATIDRHLAALPHDEREVYEVLATAATRLAATSQPQHDDTSDEQGFHERANS